MNNQNNQTIGEQIADKFKDIQKLLEEGGFSNNNSFVLEENEAFIGVVKFDNYMQFSVRFNKE